MTNDTSYREKGRAVFLAAIMVLSMVAGAAVLTGSAAATHDAGPDDEVGVTDLEGDRYWVGQEIDIDGFEAEETVEFSHEDGDFFQRTADSANSNVTVDTSDWETGEWTVEGANSSTNGTFVLSEQSLSTFEFSTDSTDGDADLSVSSNRADYDVEVSADGLSGDELDTIFGDNVDATHDDYVVLSVTDGEADITGSFGETDAGNYTLEADVADSTASATANLTVEEDAGTDGEFGQGTYNQEAGDVVDFGFDTTDVDNGDATVQIVDEHDVYNVTFNVSDYEDDSASLSMNSFLAGQANISDTFEAEDGSIENVSDDTADELGDDRLKPSRLNIYLYDGNPDNGEQLDRGIIRLQDGSLDSATTYSVDGDVSDSEIPTADLTERSETTDGDKVVTQIEATGVYGYLLDDDTFNASNGLELTLNDTADPAYGSAAGVDVDGDTNGTSVVEDAENDTFYVVVNPANVDDADIGYGETWETTFTMTGDDNPYVDEDTSVNSTFDYTENTLEFDHEEADSGSLQVSGGTISGTSSALPGTEISVSAFFETEILDNTAEVGEDGSWSAELDLSDYESGNAFTMQATNGDDTGEVPAVIAEGGSIGTSFTVEASDNGPVTVGDSGSLEYTITNDGDEAGTTDYTVTVGGEEVANDTTAELGAGNSTDAMTYEDFDTSSAGDLSWEVSTGDETASGTLTVEEEGGETNESETDGDSDGDTDDGDSDGGQPGFGLIVALFALIGAALLALRRQN